MKSIQVVKKTLTVLELMVVIFIIGIVISVVGVNMKGSMDEAKAFKSETGSRQIHEILTLEAAKDNGIMTQTINPAQLRTILQRAGFARDVEKLCKDGWGVPYMVTCEQEEIKVTSQRYVDFLRSKKQLTTAQITEKCPWMVVSAPSRTTRASTSDV